MWYALTDSFKTQFVIAFFVFLLITSGPVLFQAQAQTVTGSLPSPVRELVMDVLSEAGVKSAALISRRRSARDEAAFLYKLLQETKDNDAVRQRFGPAGHRVIEVYAANNSNPQTAVLTLMSTEIEKQIRLLGENRTEFTYVGPSKRHKFVVQPEIEIDPATFTKRLEEAFASHPDVATSSAPVNAGGAFHIEVAKTLRTISGLWRGRCREIMDDGERVRYRHVMKLTRDSNGYSGIRKSPSLKNDLWIKSRLQHLVISRRTKLISYSYKDEHGKKIDIVGRFNDVYNRIKFEKNTSGAKCRLRKRF